MASRHRMLALEPEVAQLLAEEDAMRAMRQDMFLELPEEDSKWSYTNPSKIPETLFSNLTTFEGADQSMLSALIMMYNASGKDLTKIQLPVSVAQIKTWKEESTQLRTLKSGVGILNDNLDDARATIESLTRELKDSVEYAKRLEERARHRGDCDSAFGSFRGGTNAG